MKLTPERIRELVAEHGSIRRAARAIGRDDRTLRRVLKRAEGEGPVERATLDVDHDAGTAVATLPVGAPLDAVEALIREHGLDPDEWDVVTTTLSRWTALGKADPETGRNPVIPMRQVKVTLRRRLDLLLPRPATHVPELVAPRPVRAQVREPDVVIVEGDHQAPYHDEALDAAVTRMTHDLQPAEHVFLGDLMDFPSVSRHADHPAAMAGVNECIQAGYHILRRRAEAAPAARRWKLKGNHDWRPEAELLARAERMYGIVAADEGDGHREPLFALARALHLDRLGVELVEDPRGWQHAEVELVPGIGGLVVRHGWLVGAKTAERSLLRRGRSLLVGHTHAREHVFVWDPSAGLERQAAVVGAMCSVRGEGKPFPHFAPNDGWLQGCATVTRWPDGRFVIEHARWVDGRLLWRDRCWEPA